MRSRRGRSALASQPALIGAVTILIAVVATYFAYGANSGVPFVPAYRIIVNAPDAGHLFRDADVRLAGTRIGQVTSTEAVPHANGTATARLHLTLSRSAGALPIDSTFEIQPRSYTGAEYVKVRRGHARATIPDGGAVPLRRFAPDVTLNDLLSTYDAPVRRGMRQQLRGLSYGFAGRGRDLNRALGSLDVLLRDLRPAARVLRASSTHLPRLIGALSSVSAEVAPVGREQAEAFVELHRTFAALIASRSALRDAIVASPPSEAALVRDAPTIDVFLRASSRLSAALAPAARALPRAGRTLSAALRAAPRGLPATRRALPRLGVLARAIGDLATAPPVIPAVDRLSLLGSTLRPLIADLAPAETRCRYASLLFRNLASALQEGPDTGAALRVVLVAANAARDSEAVLAGAPSANRDAIALGPLHSNPYPYSAGPGQPRACQAGHESYRPNTQVIGNSKPLAGAVTESPQSR